MTGFPVETILLSFLFLLMLFSLLEVVARQPAFQDALSFPRMDSRHSKLGPKYARLLTLMRQVGHVDCIAIGSSTVDQAFNPAVFATAYEAETGQPIHCFNFALDAIAPAANSQIAAILVADFHPDLLIIGTDPRDMTIAQNDRDVTVITETPWIRYRSGMFDVRGWLMEHAYVYRYLWHFKQLFRGYANEVLRKPEPVPIMLGQTPETTTDFTVTDPDMPLQEDDFLTTIYLDRLSHYQILPENIDGLRKMAQMNNTLTQVILVEMPVPAGYFRFFHDPDTDYAAFVNQVQQIADESQVPFWQTNELNLIPDNGWFDFSHVNVTGAQVFSQWLGQQVGISSQELSDGQH